MGYHSLVLLGAQCLLLGAHAQSMYRDIASQLMNNGREAFTNIVSDNVFVETPEGPRGVDLLPNPHGPPVDERTKQRGPSQEYYDYIVVGGGAVGCPLARTLADGGKSVLLMERGGPRKDHHKTLDIYGAGIVLGDQEASQTIVTTQGVRSHIGSVLSGGTAINIAINIEETPEYFQYLEQTFPGVRWDWNQFNQANHWVKERVANPMPGSPYGDRWRQALEDAGYRNIGYSSKLNDGYSWDGSSLFNATKGWFRHGSDVLLGRPGVDFPHNLEVVLRHTVDKVEFAAEPGYGPRATCVIYHRTEPADYATIQGRPRFIPESIPAGGISTTFSAFVNRILDPFGRSAHQTKDYNSRPHKYKRVCVKPGGEIILSAGAVLSPIILFKSGIGPRDQIRELEVPLIAEHPNLGRNVSDRVLIPVGLFFDGPLPDEGFPPRICQSLGIRKSGPNCDHFKMGDFNKQCSYSTCEEISGARTAEGIICGTRFLLPPEKRSNAASDVIFKILADCGNGRFPYDSPWLKNMCLVAQPLVDCFRRVAANFYFSSEPKSRGYIKMTKEGDVIVEANYLQHPYDADAAGRGVSNIIKMVNSGIYEGVFAKANRQSCPFYILNGLLQIVTNLEMKTRGIIPDIDRTMVRRLHKQRT
eukprot:GHVN01073927.1.p1 GENE.GHVN01073927.1~~GHVN01073927.1.p1  ORF type:complete len:644 (+),score=44.48 GHVN01073927.1:1585-3516(+)